MRMLSKEYGSTMFFFVREKRRIDKNKKPQIWGYRISWSPTASRIIMVLVFVSYSQRIRYFILMLDSKTPGMDLYGLLLRDGCFGFSWSCRKVSLSRSFISSGSFFISLLNRLVGCIFSIICTKRLSDHHAAFIFPLGEHFI